MCDKFEKENQTHQIEYEIEMAPTAVDNLQIEYETIEMASTDENNQQIEYETIEMAPTDENNQQIEYETIEMAPTDENNQQIVYETIEMAPTDENNQQIVYEAIEMASTAIRQQIEPVNDVPHIKNSEISKNKPKILALKTLIKQNKNLLAGKTVNLCSICQLHKAKLPIVCEVQVDYFCNHLVEFRRGDQLTIAGVVTEKFAICEINSVNMIEVKIKSSNACLINSNPQFDSFSIYSLNYISQLNPLPENIVSIQEFTFDDVTILSGELLEVIDLAYDITSVERTLKVKTIRGEEAYLPTKLPYKFNCHYITSPMKLDSLLDKISLPRRINISVCDSALYTHRNCILVECVEREVVVGYTIKIENETASYIDMLFELWPEAGMELKVLDTCMIICPFEQLYDNAYKYVPLNYKVRRIEANLESSFSEFENEKIERVSKNIIHKRAEISLKEQKISKLLEKMDCTEFNLNIKSGAWSESEDSENSSKYRKQLRKDLKKKLYKASPLENLLFSSKSVENLCSDNISMKNDKEIHLTDKRNKKKLNKGNKLANEANKIAPLSPIHSQTMNTKYPSNRVTMLKKSPSNSQYFFQIPVNNQINQVHNRIMDTVITTPYENDQHKPINIETSSKKDTPLEILMNNFDVERNKKQILQDHEKILIENQYDSIRDTEIYEEIKTTDSSADSTKLIYEIMAKISPASEVVTAKEKPMILNKVTLDHEQLLLRNVDKSNENHNYETIDSQTAYSSASICKVKSYTPMQVVEILEELDLSCYKETFLKEIIDGELFLELTDDILEHDLGIDNPLDRDKIKIYINNVLNQSHINTNDYPTKNKGTESKQVVYASICDVKSYSSKQVVEILEELDLSCYKETFIKEIIEGELFLELTGEMLEHDLGIDNLNDRNKIMIYINNVQNQSHINTNDYSAEKISTETKSKQVVYASISDVKSYSPIQVVKILEELSLSCYKEIFLKEIIDGELFLELTGDILEHDLGIDNLNDRNKIMIYINNILNQ